MSLNSRWFCRFVALALVALGVAAHAAPAGADEYASMRDNAGRLMNVPVYDPVSKSYFALYHLPYKPYDAARHIAAKKSYRGVRGRLAIIRSKETNDLIKQTLRPRNAFFGLQLVCYSRKLVWVNNDELVGGEDFTDFGKNWFTPVYKPCQRTNELYAAAVIADFGDGLHWHLQTPGHFIHAYLVEFPTGAP